MSIRSSALGLVVLCGACHSDGLTAVAGALRFSAPDDPAALTQPDAGVVLVDFGQVVVDSTKTLTVDLSSLAGQVTLGAVTGVQPDPEFTLPLVPGSVVGTAPTAVVLSFTPTSVGTKNAAFSLTDFSPGTAIVSIQLTGQGIADGLSVSPNPLDFGRVELNQTQIASLTIANQSSLPATLTVSPLQGTDAALFTLGAPAATALAPGASTTLTASFAPLTAEKASASFTIAGWPTTDPITVNLTGTGVETWLEVTPLLNFNFVQVDHVLVKSAVLTNLSSFTTLHLVGPPPAVSGAELSLLSFTPNPIGPGQSVSIPVQFAPYAYGLATGSLTLSTDDPLEQHPVVPLQGYGGGPEIYCYPRLSFEPALVGTAQTLQTICLNAGTVIPDHPEITLQFSEADISTDNPVFTAGFWTRDGGLPPADAGVSLNPGETAAINVTFIPSDAGPDFGKLTVASNDLNDADAGTLLGAEGLAPTLCNLQVAPSALDFEEVPKGQVGKMQFELTNVGQDYCVVTDVELDPTSDPAFSLLVGFKGPELLSFVGNTGFPAGLPTSILLEAQFAPTTSKIAAAGVVTVSAYDTPNILISLTGTSQTGCLSIQPPSFDFGILAFDAPPPQYDYPGSLCLSASTTFTAVNSCAQPLTISQISAAPGPYTDPQFSVVAGPPLPVALAGGEQTSFVAGFTPTTVGPKVGDILVTSSDLPETPYLVTLAGDPEVTGTRTDTFTFPTPPKKVDLAVILDNDDDYVTSIEILAAALPQLVAAMDQSQIDYQIAVTSTDTCEEDGSDQGSFEPCDFCLSTAQSNPSFVTPATTPDPATALGGLLGFFAPPARANCEALIGDEHLFDAMAEAFSPSLLKGHNSGFIRSDAYLAILMANGDDEDDANGNTTLAAMISLVESLKPDPSQLSFSYLYQGGSSGAAQLPPRVGALVQATGGAAINIADRNWDAQLVSLFSYGGEGQAFFALASTPADPTKVQVKVNGVLTTSWALYGNQLILTGTPLPAPGATITVTYQVGC